VSGRTGANATKPKTHAEAEASCFKSMGVRIISVLLF
jgi:hypothetical protein